MKKLITFSAFALALGLVLNPSFIYTNSASAPAGHTGAPGEGTCANVGCHVGNPVISTGSFIQLSTVGGNNLNSGYTPGTTYNMTLNTNSTNKPKHGFSMTALDVNGNVAGDYAISGNNNNFLLITTLGNKIYIGHKAAGSTSSWTFQWTAPATDAGIVTFYIAANGADNNSLQTGDQIYTTSYTVSTSTGLTQGTGTGIKVLNADDNGISIFPNPVKDRMFVSYNVAETENVTIDLYNLNGQIVQSLLNERNSSGNHNETLNLNNNINKGLYIVRVNMGEKTFFKKVLVD
jgi:hypothetical protein